MCALPLSKVLPQRKTNSLDAERENFERTQNISISKAINSQESPVKEKHVRSAIIGTFTEKGAGTFWSVVMKLPLQGNPITCWKFCHVLHKVTREGHPHAIADSLKYQTSIRDLGKLWGLLKEGYGRLIQCYCKLLLGKLEFHRKNPRFPGNLSVTDEELDIIGERDVNVFFQLSCEFFDYMDEVLALQSTVFGSLDMSRSNSMTNCGQCRLAPLIPCIQDSSQLYDFSVKILFKLHAALPPDTLIGHRERFSKQFKALQQFYLNASNLQYFKHLIHVPLLPEKPPNFLVASDLSAHVSPVVILPPQSDTPENETVDMNLVDTSVPKASPDVLEGVFGHRSSLDCSQRNGSSSPNEISEKDMLIVQLQREIEILKMDIQRSRIEYERKIDDLKRQMVNLEALISDQEHIIQSLKDENETLKPNAVSAEATEEMSLQLTEAEKKTKVQEEKFLKMRDVYSKLREEHISLIRNKAELDKQNTSLKIAAETINVEKESLIQRIAELTHAKSTELVELQKSENYKIQLTALYEEKVNLQKKNLEIEELLSSSQTKCSALESEFNNLTTNMHNLDLQLKEASLQNDKLHAANAAEKNKKYSYLDSVFKEAQHIVQSAVDDFESSAVSSNSNAAEHFLQKLNILKTTADQFGNSYSHFLKNSDDVCGVMQYGLLLAHLLSNNLKEGKIVSNSSSNIDQGDELAYSCKSLGLEGIDLFKVLQQQERQLALENIQKVSFKISDTLKIMEAMVPNMSENQTVQLGDAIEKELKQMDLDIEEAAHRIQDMLNKSKVADSGVKLKVNGEILDSCTDLMQNIKVLVQVSKKLQEEIVSQGKGSTSIHEFYNRNHRWTEGLISAAKVVGLGAKFLVDAADKVVSKQSKFEELAVASQQIAAATAQLVIASRVKADRGSERMARVSQASKNVTEATANVVATAKSCAEMVEESDVMDFSKLSLHQAKRLEVESQVRVLELESLLEKERVKLAGLRKQHYHLAGASEGWEVEDITH